MGSSLYVEVPGEPDFEVRLDKDFISVGRAEENVLGLRDMNVSRQHFIIERRDNTWLVRDKGSRNGTLVNRQPVYDKVLRDGDKIQVGGSTLTFRAQASRLSVSTDEAPRPKPSPLLKESSLNQQALPQPQPQIAPMAVVSLPLGQLPPSALVPPPPIGAYAAGRQTANMKVPSPQPTAQPTPQGSPQASPQTPQAPPVPQSPLPTLTATTPSPPGTKLPQPGPPKTPPPIVTVKNTARGTSPMPTFAPPETPAAAFPRPQTQHHQVQQPPPQAQAPTPASATPRTAPLPTQPMPNVRARDLGELDLPELPATAPERPVADRSTTPLPMGARNLGPVSELLERNPIPTTRPLGFVGKPDRWKKLAELTAAINQEHDLERLLERIIDGILSLVSARGAFLVTLAGEELEMRVARNFDTAALDDPDSTHRLSYQTCREALASKRPILTKDAQTESDLAGFESISNLKLKAILCVPFGFAGQPVGVVYLDEPVIDGSSTDLIELVAAFGDLAGIAFANARHIEEVKRRERLSEELKIASRIQRKLLPETAPDVAGLELAGRTIPAEEVGGDVYDFFLSPTGDLFISIGDVSGKGAGAGIVMASVRALLRAYVERESRTDRLLIAVNHALVRDLERGSFVSLILLRYNPASRGLAYAGAGHEHLLLVRAKGGAVETLRSGGVALGLSPNLEGRVEEKKLELAPGDQVVLYTDGATEAATPEGEELGLERLAEIVGEARGSSPMAMTAHVIDRVQKWTGAGHPPRDDLTVVALRRS